MAYTGQEIFERAMAVMDEISETGALNPDDVAEYKAKAPLLLDIWSHRMAKTAGKKKSFEISCVRKKNLLGDIAVFGKIIENNGETQEYSANGAYCFYIEVDGDCTVTFTENGSPLSGKYVFNNGEETEFNGIINITVPEGTSAFYPLKGILNASGGNVTMTISGDYYFKHNNRCLYPYKYPSADKVPDFKPYYKVELPDDFISRVQIISEYPQWQYQEGTPSVKWENDREMYVMFSYEGLIRVNYVSLPPKITSLNQVIDYPEHIAMSAVPYLVKHFARSDREEEIARDAQQEFAQMFVDSAKQEPLTPTEIIDIYFCPS